MPKLSALRPRLSKLDTRALTPPPKTTNAHYRTSEHQAWRTLVMERARWRCEWMDGDNRCTAHSPTDRMYADHIVEIEDGGARLDTSNGQALCHTHHEIKTAQARARRAHASASTSGGGGG